MRDMKSKVEAREALASQTINTDTTTAGAIIDTLGFGEVLFGLQSATITLGTATPLIEHGDASDLADAAAVADSMLNGTEAGAQLIVTDDNAIKTVGYVGDKRYVRLSVVSTASCNGVFSAFAVLGRPADGPVA